MVPGSGYGRANGEWRAVNTPGTNCGRAALDRSGRTTGTGGQPAQHSFSTFNLPDRRSPREDRAVAAGRAGPNVPITGPTSVAGPSDEDLIGHDPRSGPDSMASRAHCVLGQFLRVGADGTARRKLVCRLERREGSDPSSSGLCR